MAYRLECPACGSGWVIQGEKGVRRCRKCGYREVMQEFEKVLTLKEAQEFMERGVRVIMTDEEKEKLGKRG